MLALKGYEETSGFSVMNTDELFFISGGSGTYEGNNEHMIPAPIPVPPSHIEYAPSSGK